MSPSFVSVLASSLALSLIVGVPAALAQRADENAMTDAEDAFGSNVGGQSFGLYDPFDVRGFSPTEAGAVRLEGLYFDRQAELTSRLVEGARVRVGPSALAYAFPAPSGIADYRFRRPGARALLSVVAETDTWGGGLVEMDGQVPLVGETLGLAGGFGVYWNEYASGNSANVASAALVGRWRPSSNVEILPFWSRIHVRDEEMQPIFVGSGDALPPAVRRRRFIGQPWADDEAVRSNYGVLADVRLESWRVRGGVFRSVNSVRENHALLHHAPLDAAAPARRRVLRDPPSERASTSGELNAARTFRTGPAIHQLILSARGRLQDAVYGGGRSVDIAPAPYGEPGEVPRIDFVLGERTRSEVRQTNLGVSWQAAVAGVGRASVGVQRADYQKDVFEPAGPLPVSEKSVWLYNTALAWQVNQRLTVYAAATRGLEESPVAPQTAVNRDEAPPAVETRQVEAGVQWALPAGFNAIAGVFRIDKPYYGLDAANVFGRRGDIRHQGVEVSLLGAPIDGLDLVLGGVWLDAEISGDEVASGAIGPRPVGTPELTLLASANWSPPQAPGWSFDVSARHLTGQYGDARNRVELPDRTLVDVGLRRRLAGGTLRLVVSNLFDQDGWYVNGSHSYAMLEPRQASVRYAIDLGR
jgi:iron complex outermembrane receptor protein